MRLLIVIPNIASYRSFLSELCAKKIANGHEVHVACSTTEQWGKDVVAPEQPGVRFHPIEFARGLHPMQHAFAAGRLRRLVRTIRPDLIHAHFSAAIFTTALARASDWPMTIGTFHGVSFPARRGLGGALIRLGEVFSARRFDEICVLTEDDAVRLRQAIPALRVRTLSSAGLGCDLAHFAPAPAPMRAARRAELGFKPEHCVFIFVGRFASFKGFDSTVRAFLKLTADHPNARLLLVGVRDPLHATGLSTDEERAIRACPQIVDAGFQGDVRPHLAAADVMVFPSFREGMPVCLMEALAMGIPAITRDARGCRDVVRDGLDGIVLRECDDETICRAMAQLAADAPLRARLAAEALAGSARFSRAHFIAAQRQIYAECLAAAGGGNARSKVKVAHVSTVAASLHGLLLNQMGSLMHEGYDVSGISSSGPEVPALAAAGISHFAVSISRNISPFQDLGSLWNLWRVMRRERFTIVHTHTPKAGLLGQLAARLAGVPVIVNTIHGFYFHEHMRPAARRFYIAMEKIAALCSHSILSQNAEDMQTAIREGICAPEKIAHLGNGIDVTEFDPARVSVDEVEKLRAKLGIPAGAKVIGFVGRLAARRKGFLDFLAASAQVAQRDPNVRLLIAGDSDRGKSDAVAPEVAKDYGLWERCHFTGHVPNAELPALYRLMNVLVLPSLFEGIPRVIMEASAMGVPVVASDVKGNREAVEVGRNGVLVPFGDVPKLSAAIGAMLTNPYSAEDARSIALERFDERAVFEKVKAEYRRRSCGVPAAGSSRGVLAARRSGGGDAARTTCGADAAATLVFIVPMKSAQISRDWALASRLFERCLRAICRQTSQNFRVVVVCHERPETDFTHPNVHYIEVDFPVPQLATQEAQTSGYAYGFSEKIARQNADKARKVGAGFDYAERCGGTHCLVVDADDCVSHRLAEFVETHPGDAGWYFKKGYLYSEGRRWLYCNVANFNGICGTSVILPVSRRAALLSDPNYYAHAFRTPPPDANLTPLPFAGAVYSMANGDNIYMSPETKGDIHRTLLGMLFGKGLRALVRKVMKYRPALLTASLREEFGLYELAAPRRSQAAKRIFDVFLAATALVLLAPALLLLALLVRVKLGSPVLFTQTRPGLRARPFTICKFRTMTDARGADGALLPDADRLTSFGKFLRSTSLDELPELLNVLRGDMSFVGPRPLLMAYLPLYSREQARRHDIPPGITGWAQINGRNAVSWPEKFALDLWYLENGSLWVDVKIIALTFLKVVARDGINQEGHTTAPRFRGEEGCQS